MRPSAIRVGGEYVTMATGDPDRVLAIVEGWVMLQRGGSWPRIEALDSFAGRAREVPKRAKKGVKRAD